MKIVAERKGNIHWRALEIDSHRVSHLAIYDHVMRIGPARFKMGGIAGVSTNYQHRNKGYSRIVMEDSVKWMYDNGYVVSTLHGIEYFYEKFDFANCMAQAVAKVRTRDAEVVLKEKHPFTIRAAKDSDFAKVLRLYNTANALRPLTIARKTGSWRGIRHGSAFKHPGSCHIVELRGKFAGYFVCDDLPEMTTACEVEVTDDRAAVAVLAYLVREAIARRDGYVSVQLPPDHAFLATLRRFGCEVTITYKNTGGIMGRIINQDALLATLATEYAKLRKTNLKNSAAVTVVTELGKTRVACPGATRNSHGRLSIPATTLFQVLVGFRTAAEALVSPGVKASSGGEKILAFLRPQQAPYMYSVDYF